MTIFLPFPVGQKYRSIIALSPVLWSRRVNRGDCPLVHRVLADGPRGGLTAHLGWRRQRWLRYPRCRAHQSLKHERVFLPPGCRSSGEITGRGRGRTGQASWRAVTLPAEGAASGEGPAYRTGEKAAGISSLFSWRIGRTPVCAGHPVPGRRDSSRMRARSLRSLYTQVWTNLLSPPSSLVQQAASGENFSRASMALAHPSSTFGISPGA